MVKVMRKVWPMLIFVFVFFNLIWTISPDSMDSIIDYVTIKMIAPA
jgi:hypothetical protein